MTLKQQCRKLVACVAMLSALAVTDFFIGRVASAETLHATRSANVAKMSSSALKAAYRHRVQHASAKAVKALRLQPKPGATYAGLSKAQAESAAAIAEAFPPKLFNKAVKVAWCESRLEPTQRHKNRNGSTDHGLFQINDGGTLQGLGITKADAMNARRNAQAAYRLYKDRGWQPWVCA